MSNTSYIFHRRPGLQDTSFTATMKLSLIQEREMIDEYQSLPSLNQKPRLKLSNLRKLHLLNKAETIMKWLEDNCRAATTIKLRLPHISFCSDPRFAGYYRLED